MFSTFARRCSLPFSIGCYFVASKNFEWERQLQKDYRQWFNAHEEYKRAVKLVSKVQADIMGLATKEVEEHLYKLDPPQLLKAVKDVKSSYRGINDELNDDVKDNLIRTKQATKSDILPHSAVSEIYASKLEEELNSLGFNSTVEEREDLILLHVGMKHQYQSFAIAMASSKEAIARDRMLTTLHEKPYTLITDDEKWYLVNTRYLFWVSMLSGLGGATWILVGEKELLKQVVQAIFLR